MPELRRIEEGVRSARENVQRWFSVREKRRILSKAHAWDHVYAVARHARVMGEEIARAQGFEAEEAKRVGALSEAAGYLHDIARRATEKIPHGAAGARVIERLRSRYGFLKQFSEAELKDIMSPVGAHEVDWGGFDKETAGFSKRGKIIAQALVLGDKLFEASGHRVIERRSFFVGKERLEKDLKSFVKEYGEKAPIYAVAMESCRRLRAVNVVEDYPAWAQSLARRLHAVQEKFYYGLLKHLGLTEENLVEEMKRVAFPRFDKEEATIRKNVEKAASTEKITALSKDIADSAAEIVKHFASSRSPEEAILTFAPKGEQAKEWLEGIKNYRQGSEEYLAELVKQVRKQLA